MDLQGVEVGSLGAGFTREARTRGSDSVAGNRREFPQKLRNFHATAIINGMLTDGIPLGNNVL